MKGYLAGPVTTLRWPLERSAAWGCSHSLKVPDGRVQVLQVLLVLFQGLMARTAVDRHYYRAGNSVHVPRLENILLHVDLQTDLYCM